METIRLFELLESEPIMYRTIITLLVYSGLRRGNYVGLNGDRIKIGDKWNDTGKVFTQSTGKPMHPDTITGWIHKFVSRNNLPNICVHSLRHTNASLLIANNINITTVSKRLGHANTATTTKIYAHAIRTADEIAADTLQDILTLPNKKAN